jgi:hypothetical protein
MGADHTLPSEKGVLRYVGYRFNDKWGLFDLDIHMDHIWTGLTPSEAQAVIVEGE